MGSVSILLADNQYLIRFGLKKLLSQKEGVRVIGEVKNEAELEDILKITSPNVIILDYNQPKCFSPDTVIKIKQASPGSNVLIISDDREKQGIYQVLEYGVNSFLTKNCGENEILDAVKSDSEGRKVLLQQCFESHP